MRSPSPCLHSIVIHPRPVEGVWLADCRACKERVVIGHVHTDAPQDDAQDNRDVSGHGPKVKPARLLFTRNPATQPSGIR